MSVLLLLGQRGLGQAPLILALSTLYTKVYGSIDYSSCGITFRKDNSSQSDQTLTRQKGGIMYRFVKTLTSLILGGLLLISTSTLSGQQPKAKSSTQMAPAPAPAAQPAPTPAPQP